MDRFVASLFEKIFPPPPDAQPRQFFAKLNMVLMLQVRPVGQLAESQPKP
jgi:hypothetical protein